MNKNTVLELEKNEAISFIKKWHYSKLPTRGENNYFGWYAHSNTLPADNLFGETLYAVACYGIGVNPYLDNYLSSLENTNVRSIEIKRLCRVEPKDQMFPLTRLISVCNKKMKERGYTHVIAFSDPSLGHSGGIYRAANFRHSGKTTPTQHAIDEQGNIHHRKKYVNLAKRRNISYQEARNELGFTLVNPEQKDRWIITL